jgi:hypothetical protein
MKKETVSSTDISKAALKVCSREELEQMSRPQRMNLMSLIATRLEKAGPPPSVSELEGLKELALEHLSHPALGRLSKKLPDSQTSS